MASNTLLNPYQKMGTNVSGMTTDQALEHCGLTGWNQRLIAATVADPETGLIYDAAGLRLNVADVPGRGRVVLGAVRADYAPVQNERPLGLITDELRKAFDPLVMGAYEDGRKVFALYQWQGAESRLAARDVKPYLLVTKGNDGRGAIVATATGERAICANMIASIMRGAGRGHSISVRHTVSADVVLSANTASQLAERWAVDAGTAAERLDGQRITRRQYLAKVVPAVIGTPKPDQPGRGRTRWHNTFDALADMWDAPQQTVEDATAWRAYNAVSQWEQHARGSNDVGRATAVMAGRQPYTRRALAALAALN
jgi:hypothetical protein